MNDQIATLVAQLKERRASTFQERIKSLDIRDEIWRKYVEFSKGASFDAIAAQRTGLSPDMCCERERLTREFQRLYKSYEIDPDTRSLNHSLMVTEYSRASADQAMPSPYDLRSGPVLLHTMNYLITNIMDKFDQGREQGDWYNFLWDRLRAIRKELTQQHLRDEIAVEILEQCARFHIFCSAFLSEYSNDLFDPNLNDKMLIDCLNQLRECYLTHKKQNNTQALRNIAEFSSYMLLINLKEDNETLLRIRLLIQDITDVPEIKVALNIHRSLMLSNTTKFFSLIENDATLLQSCLLHRYFNTIRSKRLKSLIASSRNNDEFRLSDLTDILGMDNDDETKDYLEQLGYSVSNANPPSFIMTPLDNEQKPLIKLSHKLIKTKYRGNLKDIITGDLDTAVIIADNNIEDSFDLQGYFVGKLPFNANAIVPAVLRKAAPEQQQQAKPSILSKRLPSESALRSMAAATTTTNTFFMKTRQTTQVNIISAATATAPTTSTSPFRFGGFNENPTSTVPKTITKLFGSPSVPTRLVDLPPQPSFTITHRPTNTIQHVPTAVTPTPVLPQSTFPAVSERMIQPAALPPAPPVARRLSTNSMDTFMDELYDEMIDPLIRETAYDIYDELISQWNSLTKQTITIFNELLLEEISSTAHDYYDDIEFRQKMLHDTLSEQNERRRKRYLRTKYFSLWLENATEAREERLILNELQTKYHFLNNEQLFEFLTGLQLMTEHDFNIEQATDILKSRRSIKKNRLKTITSLSNFFFEEFLREELSSTVKESNDELRLRQTLLDNALKKQSIQRREHYLQSKYFSLWTGNIRQRKKLLKQKLSTTHASNYNTNKRSGKFLHLRSSKKLKENNQQYHTIKSSFDQLTTDLNQIQLFIDQLSS